MKERRCGTCKWLLLNDQQKDEAGSCRWQFSHLPSCMWVHRAVYKDSGYTCPTWEAKP